MKWVFRNDLSELGRLASELEAFAEAHSLDPGLTHAFNLCLDEIITNIISYGFEKDAGAQEIEVEMHVAGSEVRACVRDHGKPFNPLTETKAPDLDAPLEEREIGGLGVHFLKNLMDGCVYCRKGDVNVLEMRKKLP